MNNVMIQAIVPAAGKSRRMGTAKQLLPWGATTILGHVVDQLLGSGAIDEVCVVVASDADRTKEELNNRPARIVTNPDPEGDMLSSIRCALRELPSECLAVMVALGDQPNITCELIGKLVQTYRIAGKGILVPAHQGKRGHPVLISTRYRDEILTCYNNLGLRGLMHAHGDDLLEIEVPTSAVLVDIDSPEDYRREVGPQQEKHNELE
jgi:molybdenum cofactor cytidylyltransferase